MDNLKRHLDYRVKYTFFGYDMVLCFFPAECVPASLQDFCITPKCSIQHFLYCTVCKNIIRIQKCNVHSLEHLKCCIACTG